MDRAKIVRGVAEGLQSVQDWATEETALAYEGEIDAEVERLDADLEEANAALSEADARSDGRQSKALKDYVAGLLRERKDVLDLKRQHLDVLNEKRVAATKHAILKLRDKATREQWVQARKLVKLEGDRTRHQRRVDTEALAELANRFLDGVEKGDVEGVRGVCVEEQRIRISPARLTMLRKGLGRIAEKGFDLKPTLTGRGYDVVCEGKPVLGLTIRDGEWFVARMW